MIRPRDEAASAGPTWPRAAVCGAMTGMRSGGLDTDEERERQMDTEVSRLVSVDPRTVWPSEPADFTPWLRDNGDALADALGLDLELTAAEHPVGPFLLDVIGRDLTNDSVLVVENQLTPTDHGHLGQLVTYAANTDATTVIWMALSFREEHRQALAFLNELGGDKARFFGIEIAAVRIGASPPAPLFKVVAQPNDFHAQAAAAAKASSEDASGKGGLYAEFWRRFLEELQTRHPTWTRARKGPADNWITLPSPFRGLNCYGVNFPSRPPRLRCELYLDSADPAEVETRFGELYEHRDEIETVFGGELSWEALDGRRASRIAAYTPGDITQTDRHDQFAEWFIGSLERLRSALDPYA
jgi:Domain of unknown function (DUF4268)